MFEEIRFMKNYNESILRTMKTAVVTLDPDGKVLPAVRAAHDRGVLFDVGFGGFNFSWRVAERAWAQDFIPDIISSDLQQFNVAGPAYSLANVMTCFLKLGMSLKDAIERVTIVPARALRMADIAGTLKPGMPADITVFRVDSGAFTLTDTTNHTRPFDKRIVPLMAFKDGERIECELDARSVPVPPVMVQPLVENAIKHGIEKQRAPGVVRIVANKSGSALQLEVTDTGAGLKNILRSDNPGIGLANTRARLEQLYPGTHQFSVRNGDNGGCVVSLEIPFHVARQEAREKTS